MNRRNAVIGLMAASGTVITLPFWMTGCGKGEKKLISASTPEGQAMLAAIVDTLIPAGEGKGAGGDGKAPGALAVGADKYLQKLIHDCYEQEGREKFWAQLQAVEDESQAAFDVSFASADRMEREAVLLKFAGSPDKGDREFFELLKRETIKCFNTSQQVMVNYLNYKIAPGHYYGCV
jgi:hypothetical protein